MQTASQFRSLGRHGPKVSALGLGCMGMSDFYGPADEGESIATIHAALDAGVNLLDTGDFYGMGANELLLRKALKSRPRDSYLLSVKFGAMRGPDGHFLGVDGRAHAVKNFISYSLRRLGVDCIDIYRPARVDPNVPIEETVGAVADLIKAGHVRYLGLSEASAQTIRRAHAVHPVTDLQIEYSLFERGMEEQILPTCRELGIGVTAYGVLVRGLLSGHWSRERGHQPRDYRAAMPRFSDENLDANLALVDAVRAVADEKGVSVAQLAIAWVLARGDEIVPVVGARRRDRLTEALSALQATLAADDLARLEQAVPPGAVAGTRYPAAQMTMLDSEKR